MSIWFPVFRKANLKTVKICATLAWIFVTRFAKGDLKSHLCLPKPLLEWFFFGLGLLPQTFRLLIELRRTVIKQDPKSSSQLPYWYTQIVAVLSDMSGSEGCKGFAGLAFDCKVQLIKNSPWHQNAHTKVLRDIHDLSGKVLRPDQVGMFGRKPGQSRDEGLGSQLLEHSCRFGSSSSHP
jgi:hypothetical protein